MGNRLAGLLGSKGQSPYVRAFMERGNMEVMRRMTLIVLVLSGVAFASTFTSLVIWASRDGGILVCYRLQFLGMIAVNAAYAVLCRRYLQNERQRVGLGGWYTMSYVILMVTINLWITVLDFRTLGRYFFLLVALFMLYGLFFLSPVWSSAVMGVVFVVAIGGLSAMGLLSPIQVITLSSYLIIIFAVPISNYMERLGAGLVSERIVEASRHDELTGMLNRRAFEEDAPSYVGRDLFVILADIDEFKYYNDLYGHAVGDRILGSFAQCLSDAFGAERVYRFGGDEFIALFPGNDEDLLRATVDGWRKRFREAVVDGRDLRTTCSAGCVHGRAEGEEDVYNLLRTADVLLYRSKDGGRNRVTYAELSEGLMREAIVKSNTYEMPDASLDALTGLAGTDYFITHCADIAPVLLQGGHSVSFVYFDVANLKDFNAKYGFEEGDKLLVLVASVLRDVFPGRMLCPFGDDRFGLMAEDEGLVEAMMRCCSIVRDSNRGRLTSLRAGVFRYTSADVQIRVACDCARIACESLHGHYDVVYRYYTDELGERMERRSRVLERFDEALRKGYIRPFYQPIIRSVSDLTCEFEVLARWMDPNEGMQSPADFIPALEDAHLIHRLDLAIVEQVCRDYLVLRERGLGTAPVSVNFSRLDFEACDLVSEVVGLLDRYEVPRGLVRVEVTESAFAENSGAIKEAITGFRRAGLQVWMDDFGSGYSALNVLREYEFDLVKFDMSFLRGMDAANPGDAGGIMLVSLVNMAKELGLQTLVEGVETSDQLLFLRSIACEKLQGFVFGRPCSFEDLCELLGSRAYVIEEPGERAYFDTIGRVNLIQPVEPGSPSGPTGLADGDAR